MKMMYVILEELLRYVVDITILLFEIVGVFVIIISGVKGIIDYIKHNPSIRLNLATGMALGLEFKLGSEILRTVVVRDLSEIATVAAIIALRAALTFLIHWEIKVENEDDEKREELELHKLEKTK